MSVLVVYLSSFCFIYLAYLHLTRDSRLSIRIALILLIAWYHDRFPSITPGKQKPVGDHFLALFPASSVPDAVSNPPALSTVSSVGAIASTSLIPGAHSYDVCKSSGARSAVATVSFVGDQVRKMFSFMRPYAGLRRSACTKRTQSNECLMSDCPAMSSEATFLEWFS